MRTRLRRWLQMLSLMTMGSMASHLLRLQPDAGMILFAAMITYVLATSEPER